MKKIINVINSEHRKKKSSSVVRRVESEELKILEAKKELLLLEKEIVLLKDKSNTKKPKSDENQESNKQLQEAIIPATPIPYEKVLPENLPYKKPIVEISQEEKDKIVLNPNFDNIPIVCPSCHAKLKRKKIIQEGNILKQFVRCKKKCGFEKELVFHL